MQGALWMRSGSHNRDYSDKWQHNSKRRQQPESLQGHVRHLWGLETEIHSKMDWNPETYCCTEMSGLKSLDGSAQWPPSLSPSPLTHWTATNPLDPSKMLLAAENELWAQHSTDPSNSGSWGWRRWKYHILLPLLWMLLWCPSSDSWLLWAPWRHHPSPNIV